MADIEEQAGSEHISLTCDEDREARRQQAEQDTAQSHQDDAEEGAQQPQEQPAEPEPAPAQQHHQLVTVGSGSCTAQLYPADTGFPACAKADDFMGQRFFEHPAGQQYVQAVVQLTWDAAKYPFDQVRATGKILLRYAEDHFCVKGSEIRLLLTQAREDYSSGAASLLRSRGHIGQPPPKFCMLHGTISHITSTDQCSAMRNLSLSLAADATPENSLQLCKAIWRQSICNPYWFAKQAQARQAARDQDHRFIRLMLQHSSQEYLVHRRDVDDKWGKISDMSMQVGALRAVNDGLREQLQQSAEREQQLRQELRQCHRQLRHCKCSARQHAVAAGDTVA
ncbi:hypothetical protein OEZ85_014127 [Tetradesmus obliquus]|uniref:Uncharacterized protein n=1 Tax=Tetradesmus obliquus TaxID=3088 RepID=A0ABY8U816_TETOB|nr:hypothetical protein OEZ85_014127 [Tetradesmus obliquus]